MTDTNRTDLWSIEVACYTGYRGDERPIRFQWGERSHLVTAIEDQWYGPEEVFFRVITSDDETYILRRSFTGNWTIESFRRK